VSADEPLTPTLAALRQARARQLGALRWLRPLWLLLVAFLLASGFRNDPRPALSGAGLPVALALAAVTAGLVGLIGTGVLTFPLVMGSGGGLGTDWRGLVAKVSLGLLVVGSGALVWLQPDGNGLLGLVAAVITLTRLRPAWCGAAAVAVLIVFVGVAELLQPARTGVDFLVSLMLLGAVYVAARANRRFREGDSQIEVLLIELERSRNAEVRAAALAERQRVAREMHDVLAHSLSGLMVQLQGARLLATADPADPRLPDTIDRAHHLARSGLQEARRAIGVLRDDRPPSLDGPNGLAGLAAGFERDSGIRCRFSVDGDLPGLGAEAQLALYRVTQEALTNVRKHARPTLVEVRLAGRPDGAHLVIEDFATMPEEPRPPNGLPRPAMAPQDGNPPSAPDGYGLTGMRERAELLGGSLTAAPTAGGFAVDLWLPA
jgi:signal transduction histidine kinase